MPEKTGRNKIGQWTEGVSGNPQGRPPGSTSITTAIRRELEKDPKKMEELVAYYMNDERHRAQLWEQIDGKPKQKKEIMGEGGGPVETTVNVRFVKS